MNIAGFLGYYTANFIFVLAVLHLITSLLATFKVTKQVKWKVKIIISLILGLLLYFFMH